MAEIALTLKVRLSDFDGYPPPLREAAFRDEGMASGSRLHAIVSTLYAVRSKIPKQRAFLYGTGVMPDDPSFARDQAEINVLRNRLAVSVRQISNDLAYLNLLDQVATKEVRGQRYRTQQSINDRRTEIKKVYELAINILMDIDNLQESNSRPSVAAILATLLDSGIEGSEQMAQIIQKEKGHHENLWTNPVTVQNVPSLFVLAMVVGYLCYYSKKSRFPTPQS